MPSEPPPPATVAGALALRPFAASTTRRDLSTAITAFRTAWAALSQVQVLQQTCIRLAEHAAAVLCAVYARLDEVEHAERAKLQGRVVLERSYEFQAPSEGARRGAETVFKVQAAMLDLQAFATDFLALSTGPSRLDLLVLSLPVSQRALATLSSSLSPLLAHYALPHPASPATWATEDADAAREDERALPRLFQRALALRGDAWQRFLAEQPAAPGTPSQRRSAFIAWCIERNPLLGAREGEGGEEGGGAPRRRRQEASWPPARPSPTPSAPGERLVPDVDASEREGAPGMRRAVSQPAPTSGPSEAAGPPTPSRTTTPPPRLPLAAPSPPSTPPPELEASSALEFVAPRPPSPPTSPPPPTPAEQAPPPPSNVLFPPAEGQAVLVPPVDEPGELGDVPPSPTRSVSEQVEPLEPVLVACALDPPATAPSSSSSADSPAEGARQSAAPTVDEPVVDVPAILLTGDGGKAVELAQASVAVDAHGEKTVDEGEVLGGAAAEPTPSSSPVDPVPHLAAPPALRILALDGGALLGPVPQLDLLASILRPSSSISPSHSTAAPSLAEHISLLTGTGSSALLAVLLGRLALDLDAAHALYVRIAQRALALDGPPGSYAARAPREAQRRRPGRWSRLFRRSSGARHDASTVHERETSAAELAAARGRALAAALAELLPGADEPFASTSPLHMRTALLAFRPSPSGRVEPVWLVSDDPSSAHGLSVAQAVLASAAASPLVACPGWCTSPTSLSTAQGALELGRTAAAGQGEAAARAQVELVSLGTGYASLRLPSGAPSVRRAALEAEQQVAAANAVAAAALARRLEGREDVELTRLEGDVKRCGALDGKEEWEGSARCDEKGSRGSGAEGAGGGKGGLGKAVQPATLRPTTPTSSRAPLKKRASRLSFLFGSPKSRHPGSAPASPSPRRASSFNAPPHGPPSSSPPPSSTMSPALAVPRLRTSISLDDLRRCGIGTRGASSMHGGGGGLYALGEEAWTSSASVRSS
ncbi:hypothetical protein JCM8208_003824 [Rhodotorula glutinis]